MSGRICDIGDCGRTHYARGWCKKHYDRWRSRGTTDPLTFQDRFWSKVDRSDEDDCWLWTGARGSDGRYGSSWSPTHEQATSAHRVAWEITFGLPPADLEVLHLCDTPLCVKPSHLVLGTHAANMADMAIKARADRGESRWKAKLTEDDVREIRERYAKGGVTQAELAETFDVACSVISTVVNRKAWRHVDDDRLAS